MQSSDIFDGLGDVGLPNVDDDLMDVDTTLESNPTIYDSPKLSAPATLPFLSYQGEERTDQLTFFFEYPTTTLRPKRQIKKPNAPNLPPSYFTTIKHSLTANQLKAISKLVQNYRTTGKICERLKETITQVEQNHFYFDRLVSKIIKSDRAEYIDNVTNFLCEQSSQFTLNLSNRLIRSLSRSAIACLPDELHLLELCRPHLFQIYESKHNHSVLTMNDHLLKLLFDISHPPAIKKEFKDGLIQHLFSFSNKYIGRSYEMICAHESEKEACNFVRKLPDSFPLSFQRKDMSRTHLSCTAISHEKIFLFCEVSKKGGLENVNNTTGIINSLEILCLKLGKKEVFRIMADLKSDLKSMPKSKAVVTKLEKITLSVSKRFDDVGEHKSV